MMNQHDDHFYPSNGEVSTKPKWQALKGRDAFFRATMDGLSVLLSWLHYGVLDVICNYLTPKHF